MTAVEQVLLFPCAGDELVGVLSEPSAPLPAPPETGVVILVGGPQYRVGSHRQFVLLARTLAKSGFPCLRFDRRGMGDSTGIARPFEQIDEDVRAAIDAMVHHVPSIRRVVLWGLCDAASAACLYAPSDERVAGLVLLNPWIRTEQTEAATRLRRYYLRRAFQVDFWRKAWTGRVRLGSSAQGLANAMRSALGRGGVTAGAPLAVRMAQSIAVRRTPYVLVLANDDLVAMEFVDHALDLDAWRAIEDLGLRRVRVPGAGHTFASAGLRAAAEAATLDFVRAVAKPAAVTASAAL